MVLACRWRMPTAPPSDLRQRVFEFACTVVRFCAGLSRNAGVVRQISWQLARAATSVGANLEEAKAAYSSREFAMKNALCVKEMRESLYWLRVLERCELAPSSELAPLLLEANQLTAMLTAGMKRIRSNLEP